MPRYVKLIMYFHNVNHTLACLNSAKGIANVLVSDRVITRQYVLENLQPLLIRLMIDCRFTKAF